MKIKQYTPIGLNSKINKKLNVFMDDQPIIDYMAVGEQNKVTGMTRSAMTCPEWQDLFVANHFAEEDPVRHASYYSKSPLVAFDELQCDSSFASHIMQERKKYYMHNGLVLVRQQKGKNYVLTMATGYIKFSPRDFFLKNHQQINCLLDDLIHNVFINNCPACDAKL